MGTEGGACLSPCFQPTVDLRSYRPGLIDVRLTRRVLGTSERVICLSTHWHVVMDSGAPLRTTSSSTHTHVSSSSGHPMLARPSRIGVVRRWLLYQASSSCMISPVYPPNGAHCLLLRPSTSGHVSPAPDLGE